MITVSNDFKTAINQQARFLDARILKNGSVMNYNVGSIEYNSSLGEDEKMIIGLALRSSIKITVLDEAYGLVSENFEGQEFDIQIGVKLPDSNYEYCSLGLFTVTKPIRDRDKLIFEGKDRMYLLEKPYATNLSFPATLLQIAQDIASKAGVVLKNTSFPNSDHLVLNKPTLDNETLRTAIAAVAELSGGFARITRDGKLEIFNMKTTTSAAGLYAGSDVFVAVSESTLYNDLIVGEIRMTQDNMVNVSEEELAMARISKVKVQTGDVVAETGSGNNIYTIKDNIWCQNPSAVIDVIYSELSNLVYIPFNATWQGNPAIETGDAISVDTGLGYYSTIVGSRILTFNGGLREEYEAKALGETGSKAEHVGNTIVQINKVKTEVKVLDGEFKVKISEDNEKFSQISQDLESIELRVENGEGDITTLTTRADGVDAKINATTHSLTETGYFLKDSNGEMLLTPNGVANEQNLGRADNIEDGYPMLLPFHIGTEVSQITQAVLKWDITKFRTYSKGAASGGGSTSGPSSHSTTGAKNWGANYVYTSYDVAVEARHLHTVLMSEFDHSHNMAHTHTISSHVHPPEFGILETPVNDNTTYIDIDGVHRATISIARGEIDLSAWITTNGWHSISLRTPPGVLKRIDANLFLKTYIRR